MLPTSGMEMNYYFLRSNNALTKKLLAKIRSLMLVHLLLAQSSGVVFCSPVIFPGQVGHAYTAANRTSQVEKRLLPIGVLDKGAPTAGADECVAEETKVGNRNRSVLTVRLTVISGRLAVNRQASNR